jgi:hypothetical protein
MLDIDKETPADVGNSRPSVWQELVSAIVAFFNPVMPWNWWGYASALASSGAGWMASLMFLCIAFLIAIPTMGGQENGWWLPVNWFALTTWLVVAVLAVAIMTCRSVLAIRRYGFKAPSRARWWFELATMTWNIATLSLTGVLLCGPLADRIPPFFDPFLNAIFSVARVAFVIWFALATMGYLVSLVSRQQHRGRAFECTHYFYCLIVPLMLITWGGVIWPNEGGVREVLIPASIVAIGIVLGTLGFISCVRRWERLEKTNLPETR